MKKNLQVNTSHISTQYEIFKTKANLKEVHNVYSNAVHGNVVHGKISLSGKIFMFIWK